VRKFVQVQAVDLEVGDLINKTSIFGPNAKIPRHIKVHAAAVRKGSTDLTIDSIREIVDGIENKRAAARQGIGANVCNMDGDMKHKGAEHFVHITAN